MPLFERGCCTPSPPVIREAPDIPRRETDRHPDDRPQVADRSATHRCFRAPGSQRAPAALPRRVTAADIMCSVVPAGAELRHVELFGNSTAGAPAGSPLAPPLRTKPAHAARTQPSARHHPRAGTSRRVGALVRLNADLRSDSAAARRCPWQQQVPPHHPPAASASLSHATPPPMHTSNATSDPAATGSSRGDEASASTDRHNSSVTLHVFALCR